MKSLNLGETVSVAKQFETGTNETLIIVTVDHEAGGMTASWQSSGQAGEDGPFYTPDGRPFYINWSTTGHTATNVPVTSMDLLSDWLVGVNDNTYLYDVMIMLSKEWIYPKVGAIFEKCR